MTGLTKCHIFIANIINGQSSIKSFTNGLLLFTYAITELKNQLRMECVEKANILSKLWKLYFSTVNDAMNISYTRLIDTSIEDSLKAQIVSRDK